MALPSRSVNQSQHCTEGPSRGDINLVFPGQHFRALEVIAFSPLGPWQTYAPLAFHYSTYSPVLIAGSGKSVLWFVISCCCGLYRLKLSQFRDNRRYYGSTRGRISDDGTF